MPDDTALSLYQTLRPAAPTTTPDIRRAGPGGTDLHSLAMVPGSPAYNARIPRPPCHKCGEDHVPNLDYGHDWVPEPVHDEPVSASAIMRRPAPAVFQTPAGDSPTMPLQRVALYVGRGDLYVVSVESAPDWDAVDGGTFKVEGPAVLPLIKLARALGAKIADKTGGDLLMLEQEHGDARSQPPQNYVRGAQGTGDRQPRRHEPAADWSEEDQPGQDTAAAG